MNDSSLPISPSFRLDGRRALVTGASRGLGLACAVALANAGAHVTLAARNKPELDQVVNEIQQQGGQAEAWELDVLDTSAIRAGVAARAPFDVLVNNAGTNLPKPFLDVTEEDYDTVLELNLRSVFFVTQAVVKRLLETGLPGSIINMSSQMGHVGAANRSIYCASKHAIEGLTKSLAVELGKNNIRVNTLCPTFIETPMTKPFFQDDKFRNDVLSKIKLGRLGTVEELMGAVVFLASDASSLMTGSALKMDGGWTAE